MMTLKKIINEYDFSCFENCLISIIDYYGIPYEVVYCSEIFAGQMINDSEKYTEFKFKVLKEFYGVNSEFTRLDIEHAIYSITMNIRMSIPVIISIDSSFLPWNKNYLKERDNLGHFIIIYDYDEKNQNFLILDSDPELKESNNILSINDFKRGFRGLVVRIYKDLSIKIKEASLNNYLEVFKNLDYIEKIKASILEYFNVIAKSLNGCSQKQIDNHFSVRYFIKLYQGKLKFAYYLNFLSQLFKKDFSSQIKELYFISNLYKKLNRRYLKTILLNDEDKRRKVIEKSKKLLNDILNNEKELHDNIIKMESTPELPNSCSKKRTEIDISNYYNNKAFGSRLNSTSDITPYGDSREFFYVNNQVNNDLFKLNYKTIALHFQIKNDNILCQNQEIILNKSNIRKILFIGCSVLKSSSEKISIFTEELNIITKRIEFSDWDSIPEFNEEVYFRGFSVLNNQDISYRPVFLFAQVIDLECSYNIRSIMLPDCSNIHVFKLFVE